MPSKFLLVKKREKIENTYIFKEIEFAVANFLHNTHKLSFHPATTQLHAEKNLRKLSSVSEGRLIL